MSKQRNREIRQETLREYLSSRKLVEKALDNIEKIEELNVPKGEGGVDYKELQLKQFELNKLDKATNHRMRLINKYLADLKSADINQVSENHTTHSLDKEALKELLDVIDSEL